MKSSLARPVPQLLSCRSAQAVDGQDGEHNRLDTAMSTCLIESVANLSATLLFTPCPHTINSRQGPPDSTQTRRAKEPWLWRLNRLQLADPNTEPSARIHRKSSPSNRPSWGNPGLPMIAMARARLRGSALGLAQSSVSFRVSDLTPRAPSRFRGERPRDLWGLSGLGFFVRASV